MLAFVYRGPGQRALEERDAPDLIEPGDAVVRITRTTICGTDLHILKGDVPSCQPGTVLGHEGVGIVESVGSGVLNFHPGEHVLISCITSCGRCENCRKGMYSHCSSGGWILGHRIDGTQAEFVRIPHADFSLHHVPGDIDEDALTMLSDILPTGFECGVLNGRIAPGCSVAIVGSGPVGLAALMTAQFYSPALLIVIDPDRNRLELAQRFGATHVMTPGGELLDQVKRLTEGKGVDTVIEAVGVPSSFALCQDLVAPGGTIANIGVHGSKVDLHLERLWSHNLTITTRLVDTVTTPQLLRAVRARRLVPDPLVTHRFRLTQMEAAYRTFEQAAHTGAMKVVVAV